MRSFNSAVFIFLTFALLLSFKTTDGYVPEYSRRRTEPSSNHHHRPNSYISPVTYQARATFSSRGGDGVSPGAARAVAPVVRAGVPGTPAAGVGPLPAGLELRRPVPPREVLRVYRSQAQRNPMTYQTYDRRALSLGEPTPVVQRPVRYSEPRRQTYRPARETQGQPKVYHSTVYQTPPSGGTPQRYTVRQEQPSQYQTNAVRQTHNNAIRYDYSRGGSSSRYVPTSAARRTAPTREHRTPTFYGQPAPRRSYETRRPSRHYDPCINMYDGQYVLNHDFKKLFPYVDHMCYFVKCANKKAYLNPCGPATRNDKKGEGFCSHLDLEGFCGPSLHEYHERKKERPLTEKRGYNHGYTGSRSEYKPSRGRSYTRYL